MGVGISLSYICREVKPAPGWMKKTGLEWVFRLVQEPRRLIKRYLVDGIPFAGVLLCSSALRRCTGRGKARQRPAGRGDAFPGPDLTDHPRKEAEHVS